jgi:two-component system LytT family response regulator
MQIKALIIEDEEPARILIKNYLSNYSEIEVVAECSDGFSGVKAINEHKPDLIFLDIQMPKLTGFELLELIENKPFVIFTTAYDEFAIKAFELNAIDYLLKPFSKTRFEIAILKLKEKMANNQSNDKNIGDLINLYDEKTEIINRIAVRHGSKINIIPAKDIFYLESYGDYVKIHSTTGVFVKEKTMKYFENHLDTEIFIRIHRSFIVNVNEIKNIEQYDKDSHLAILRNNESLKISESGYKVLRQKLKI